jgi:hypothetical protein
MRRDDNPRWRVILDERWRDRLQKVTELSLAYHGATARAPGGLKDAGARRLLSPPEIRYCADCVAAVGLSASGTVTGPLAGRAPAQRVAAGRP